MPQSIPVPIEATAKYRIPLNNKTYIFIFKFNTRDSRWYFDLYTNQNILIKAGIKVMENQSLLSHYLLDDFSGDIICVKVSNTKDAVGRDNLGIDKDYELLYYSQEEIENG